MAQSYKQWDVDAVSKWLESIHFNSLIPVFERHNICGSDLPQLDDNFLRERLRITKPAEIAALKGAILSLAEPAAPPSRQAGKGASRRVSNPARPMERERSGSFDKQKTYPQTKKTPTTMPRNFTVSGGEDFSATREPQLQKGASAPSVLDDRCRYSGWIRKQGGGYKNCEWASCSVYMYMIVAG